jgi:hypothetical protein
MNILHTKMRPVKNSRVKLGDIVTFLSYTPFVQGRTPWGTIVEQVDRGVTGKHMLCGIQWFNMTPGQRGHISYHYSNELVQLEEKLSYDAVLANVIEPDSTKA